MRLLILAVIVLASWPARGESAAQEFSAEIVSRNSRGEAAMSVARLFAARGKVRIEVVAVPGAFFLIEPKTPALLVRPGQRMYVNARLSTPLTQLFVPIDAKNACAQWLAAFADATAGRGVAEWRCEPPAGRALRGGLVEFNTESGDQGRQLRYLDARLQFPVKVIDAQGESLTLEQIRIAPQPAELFTVPRDYHALDPQALIERIKKSDVWADPSNP